MAPFKNPSVAALQNRSRFCEGSMNDRASAAPPVRFLDPEALAALERPLPVSSSSSDSSSNPRASHDTGTSRTQTWSRKTGSRLFGQVWEGVRGKLRLRKDDNNSSSDASKVAAPAVVISAAKTTTAVTTTNAQQQQPQHIPIYTDPAERDGPPASRTRSKLAPAAAAAPIDIPSASTAADFQFTGFPSARPSRDEVLASYQQLMAGGFFHAHAIPSSRPCLARPPPGTSLPASASSRRPATAHASSPPPQWPLASPFPTTTAQEHVQSPTSVSSRGTKRAAVNDSDGESAHDSDAEEVYDKENQAPPHPNTVHDKKRLRRSASREGLFLPKIRTTSSSSTARRSLSTSHALPAATNKLQKRRPQPRDVPATYQQQQQQSHARPRHVSDGGGSARVLRGRAAEDHRSMRVVPDEGRGIPRVPAIPAQFTYGEDRQHNGPWRGLRVR